MRSGDELIEWNVEYLGQGAELFVRHGSHTKFYTPYTHVRYILFVPKRDTDLLLCQTSFLPGLLDLLWYCHGQPSLKAPSLYQAQDVFEVFIGAVFVRFGSYQFRHSIDPLSVRISIGKSRLLD